MVLIGQAIQASVRPQGVTATFLKGSIVANIVESETPQAEASENYATLVTPEDWLKQLVEHGARVAKKRRYRKI